MAPSVLLLFRSLSGLIWTRHCSKEQTFMKHEFLLSVESSVGGGGSSLYTRSGQKINTLIYCHHSSMLIKGNNVLCMQIHVAGLQSSLHTPCQWVAVIHHFSHLKKGEEDDFGSFLFEIDIFSMAKSDSCS